MFLGRGVETSQKSPVGHFMTFYGCSVFDHGSSRCVS